MEKIPVNIISGFLGSGKTTAIIKLLKEKTASEKWAVIINEFGKISIDGQTLRSSSDAGSVFDIAGGCICCSAKGHFQENLEKIIQSGNFSRIIVEPSGLGGIDLVTEVIEAKPGLILMPAICMVDITAIENPRFQINMIYRSQIDKAKIIVFSKCDLLANETILGQLVDKFKTLYREKHCCIVGEQLSTYLLQKDNPVATEKNCGTFNLIYQPSPTDRNFYEKNFFFSKNQTVDSSKLFGFFSEHPQILRAKGHIQTENGWELVNYTVSGCIFEPCRAKQQNELVIIGEGDDLWIKNLDFTFERFCI